MPWPYIDERSYLETDPLLLATTAGVVAAFRLASEMLLAGPANMT